MSDAQLHSQAASFYTCSGFGTVKNETSHNTLYISEPEYLGEYLKSGVSEEVHDGLH